MADQKSRGGKKEDNKKQVHEEQGSGVAATTNKNQPGHAQDGEGRQKYLEETSPESGGRGNE